MNELLYVVPLGGIFAYEQLPSGGAYTPPPPRIYHLPHVWGRS